MLLPVHVHSIFFFSAHTQLITHLILFILFFYLFFSPLSFVHQTCLVTLLTWLKQGQTGLSCRTCWLTWETQRTCPTCSLPPLPNPGPTWCVSTKGTDQMKVLKHKCCSKTDTNLLLHCQQVVVSSVIYIFAPSPVEALTFPPTSGKSFIMGTDEAMESELGLGELAGLTVANEADSLAYDVSRKRHHSKGNCSCSCNRWSLVRSSHPTSLP